jgi:ATP-binding cassette, subfamily C, bacterial CydD
MMLERRPLPAGRNGRRALFAAVALGAASATLVVAQAVLLARVIAGATRAGSSLVSLAPALALLAGVAVLRASASWSSDTAAARGAADVRLALRAALTSRLLALGPRFVASERTGELVGTLGAGVESTDAYVARYQPQLALSFLVPLLVGAAVLRADLLSGLVLAATWPLIPLFMYLIGGVARRRSQAQWVALSRMSARFLDTVQGIATLVTLGRAADEAAVVASTSERFRALTMEVLKVAFLSALTLEWLATLGTAVIAVELGLRLLSARISFEAALFILVVTPEFYRPMRALGAAFHAAMTGHDAVERMSELLDQPAAQVAATEVAEPRLDADSISRAGLSLDDVSFRYSPDRPVALDRVSFSVAPGTTVALIGPSGSGKSTIAHLVLRFLEPDSGQLLAGGHPLATVDADLWRRQVAWLPQRPHLFHGTVLDNLRLARPDASDSDIERAIVLAHADEFVRGLPGGLRAEVGEEGSRLSGGEAQRLALARAFLKDTPLLVLDEPTSHLDPENDSLVSDAVRELARGRTVLLIAHRLTAVAGASHVVVLSRGRVAEQGTHAALAAQRGLYARMLAAAEAAV